MAKATPLARGQGGAQSWVRPLLHPQPNTQTLTADFLGLQAMGRDNQGEQLREDEQSRPDGNKGTETLGPCGTWVAKGATRTAAALGCLSAGPLGAGRTCGRIGGGSQGPRVPDPLPGGRTCTTLLRTWRRYRPLSCPLAPKIATKSGITGTVEELLRRHLSGDWEAGARWAGSWPG